MSNIISIGISDFGLQEYLETYPIKARIVADKAALKAAKEGRSLLLVNSPVKSGRYSKGWSVRNKSTVAGGVAIIITVVPKEKQSSLCTLARGWTRDVY